MPKAKFINSDKGEYSLQIKASKSIEIIKLIPEIH